MKKYGTISGPAAQTPSMKKASGSPRIAYSKRSIIRTPASQTPPRKA